MKFKSEKGFTGVDIAIAVIVLFMFVSLIAVLSYNFSSSSKELELKSKATYIAIDEIEKMKNLKFDEIAGYRKNEENKGEYLPSEEIADEEGFYRRVLMEDYADIDTTKIPGLVKKVTVEVTYMYKGKEEKVELSTVLSKES